MERSLKVTINLFIMNLIYTKNRISSLLLASVLAVLSAFLVLFNLGAASLHPWDEAWYADISRNLVNPGQIFDLKYNQTFYWDHPPLGFWLEAVSFKIFGVSEFSARLPQALLGIASVILIFLIGRKLKNELVGLNAGLILLSSRWFLFRARTGNLDILLAFTQLLVFYFSLKLKSKTQLFLLWFAFALAMISKSVISITLLPLILLVSLLAIKNKHFNFFDLFLAILHSILLIIPWYVFNTFKYGPHFLIQNIFKIGLRQGSTETVTFATVAKTILYLRIAIHKWYHPAQIALPLAIILSFFAKNFKLRLLLFYLFLASFPYFVSARTEIWHLIPIIGPLSLLIALVADEVLDLISIFISLKLKCAARKLKIVATISFSIVVFVIASISLFSYWKEFISLHHVDSDIKTLSKVLNFNFQKDEKPIALSHDDYLPAFVFYANLSRSIWVINAYGYEDTCHQTDGDFYALTRKNDWLSQSPAQKYLLFQAGDFLLYDFEDPVCADLKPGTD